MVNIKTEIHDIMGNNVNRWESTSCSDWYLVQLCFHVVIRSSATFVFVFATDVIRSCVDRDLATLVLCDTWGIDNWFFKWRNRYMPSTYLYRTHKLASVMLCKCRFLRPELNSCRTFHIQLGICNYSLEVGLAVVVIVICRYYIMINEDPWFLCA